MSWICWLDKDWFEVFTLERWKGALLLGWEHCVLFLFLDRRTDILVLRSDTVHSLKTGTCQKPFFTGRARQSKLWDMYGGSFSYWTVTYSFIHFTKVCIRDDPNNVVTITMTNATVIMNFLCCVSICKQRANAMTPLTMPEYQQIYLLERINFLPKQ